MGQRIPRIHHQQISSSPDSPEDYPGIKLKVALGNSMKTLDRLFAYSADVALLAHVTDNPAIYAVPFSRHPVVVFVNKKHPFAVRKNIKLEELQAQRFIHRERGSTTRLAFEEALENIGISVNTVLEMGSREAVWSTVEQGMGIGVVSDIEFVPHPNLCTVEISDADIYTTAHLACLEDRKNAKIIKAFFEVATAVKNNDENPTNHF
jgi:DNA-binding transcriptional LysR family regulator